MPKKLTDQEISTRLKGIPGWERKGQDISRLYVFSGFIAAMAFVNHVAGLAETMDHHPDFLIQYKSEADAFHPFRGRPHQPGF